MKCCICQQEVAREDAPVLTYGGYGHPRVLCDRCDACLTSLTRGREPATVRTAMEELSALRPLMDERDMAATRELTLLVDGAAERLRAIEAGEYDFAAEEAEDGAVEDVPEELLETEEEREAEEQREERERKNDRIFSYVWSVVMVAAIAAIVYILFLR